MSKIQSCIIFENVNIPKIRKRDFVKVMVAFWNFPAMLSHVKGNENKRPIGLYALLDNTENKGKNIAMYDKQMHQISPQWH